MSRPVEGRQRASWALCLLAIAILLVGAVLAVGGARLILLGGSAYYLLAGAGMAMSAVLLLLGRRSGAWFYALVFTGTLLWTAWESGLDYWRWVPRLGLVTAFAFLLALLSPRLGVARRSAHRAAAAMAALFVAAVAFAFVPMHVTAPTARLPDRPLVAAPAAASPVQPEGDWRAYGRDDHATRHSPLARLTPANVDRLQRAWVYRTGDLPPADKPNKWAAQTTPLKVGDAVFLCSATNDLIRLDAASGREIWRYESEVRDESIPYTAACRGVVYHESDRVPEGQPCRRRIVEATLDMRLIAVDAGSGKPCADFGESGQVDLMIGLGPTVPGFAAASSPPALIGGVLVANHEVLDGQRRWAPSGVIRGYDADSGQFLWAWDVNRPGERGEPPPGRSYSRGTPNSWGTMSGDETLGLVYVPTGNSAVDYYSAMRTPQENAVSSSVVALDVRTGEPRWVFQTVHKDVWDYDLGAAPTLIDYPAADGSAIAAMIVPTRRGQNFVLDRRDGTPLTPVEERPAPAGVMADDPRAPTQPWSTGMPRLGFADLTERDMWGLTPLDQLWCRIQFRRARYEGEFTAPSLTRPWIEYPGYNGGTDWGGVAFDPARGVMIANWNNTPMYDQLLTREQADAKRLKSIDDPAYEPGGGGAEGAGAQADTPYGIDVSPFLMPFTQMLCNQPPCGMITAIDMHTRSVLRQRPLGTARANGPFGLPTYLPIGIGTPNNGGSIVTAGGLVFVAAATDNLIRAIDLATGRTLWSDVLPAGGQATPITYEAGGRQYLLVVAGGHHFMRTPPGDYVVAYALPQETR